MALNTMIENLIKARKNYEDQLRALGPQAQVAVVTALSPLIPTGYTLQWKQYTPSFSDGDPCVFRVNDPYLVRDTEEGNDWDLNSVIHEWGVPDSEVSYTENDWNAPRDVGGGYKKITKTYTRHGFPVIEGWTKGKVEELFALWKTLPEDLLKKAFGDGCTVIIKSDGTYTNDEYYD